MEDIEITYKFLYDLSFGLFGIGFLLIMVSLAYHLKVYGSNNSPHWSLDVKGKETRDKLFSNGLVLLALSTITTIAYGVIT